MTVKREKKPKRNVSAQATAKLEAVAKVAYSRKRITTEMIPPDVTRAKTSRWLDLISPITEWAGLKGDALNHRRQQLRIQQEDSLLRLANELRNKMAGQEVLQPVPPKILVPILEKASLEDPSDDVMIERWANLLASAAQKVSVQPRFVGILSELAGSQADCLEHIAFHYYEGYKFPCRDFIEVPLLFAGHYALAQVRRLVQAKLKTTSLIEDISDSVTALLLRPGIFLQTILWEGSDSDDSDDFFEGYDCVAQTGVRRDADLAVLESLGLIRHVVLELEFDFEKPKSREVAVRIYYYHLTFLGVEFCQVCSRPRVLKLQEIDDRNGKS